MSHRAIERLFPKKRSYQIWRHRVAAPHPLSCSSALMHDAAAICFRFEKQVGGKGSEDKGAMMRYPSKPAHSLKDRVYTAGPALVSWHGFGRRRDQGSGIEVGTLFPRNHRGGVLVELFIPGAWALFVSSYNPSPICAWPRPIDRSRRENANGTSLEIGN